MLGKWVIFASLASVMTVGLGTAVAQESPRNSWGVTGSFSDFTLPSGIIPGNKNVDLNGYNGKFGFVYGNEFGGDWEFLGVMKDLNNLTYDNTTTYVPPTGGTPLKGGALYTGSPRVMGGEVRKYFRFANLGHHWQVGLNVGLGVGAITGNIQKQQFTGLTTVAFNPATGAATFTPGQGPTVTTTQPASTMLSNIAGLSVMPLFETEFVVAVNVTPNFKLKFSGGLDFPGVGGEVSAVYFFHRR